MSAVPKENLTPEEKKQKKEQSKEKEEIDKQVIKIVKHNNAEC